MWIETSSVLRMVSKIDGLYPPDTSVTSVYKLTFCTYGYKFTYCSPLFDFRMLITVSLMDEKSVAQDKDQILNH
jgi:hypothetical protein